MTIRELIEKLQTFDLDRRVKVDSQGSDEFEGILQIQKSVGEYAVTILTHPKAEK